MYIIAAPPKGDKTERDHSGEPREETSTKQEEDFLGFSPTLDKVKSDVMISRADVAQANAMARQLHVYKPGIDFVPGARLEVLESRDNNWYQCKIVEVDWGELDILVHYERWSNRFDEWLKMDSTRIRPLVRSSQRKDKRSSHFRVGDRVTARWAADGKRYQARVTKIFGDDQYEVLFFDGVTKVVRSGALTKVEPKSPRGLNEVDGGLDDSSSSSSPCKHLGPDDEELMLLSPAATTASSTDSRSSSPEPDQHCVDTIKGTDNYDISAEELLEIETTTPIKKSIFDVEIIDQKRKPKRKAAVEELFQSLKKKRKYEFHGKKEDTPTSPKCPQSSRTISSSPRYQHSTRSIHTRKTSVSKKKSRDSLCGTEEEGPLLKQTEGPASSETPESGACDSPMPMQSSNHVTVELEDGWKKCCTRRTHGTTAGKWDMFYIAPEGKKIRCKNDLIRYYEETGLPPETEKFDFSVKNMKDVIEAHLQETDFREAHKAQTSVKDQKEPSKDVGPGEIKEEKIDPDDKVSILETAENSKASAVKKTEVKKPEIKRTEVKLSDSPRMKIEIPIIPKSENIGTLSSSLLSSTASPWSPTMSSALPRSFSASAAAQSEESVKEEPSTVATETTVATDLSGGQSKLEATPPARQKHVLKKEPVLAPNEFVVRAEHNEHQCPKDGCGKGFRKENLLQMHIKHYHPEILKKSSSWAPNVADLAYARTVGDHLDVNASPTHASPPADKVLKPETSSKKLPRGIVAGSSSEARTKVGEKKNQGSLKGASTSKETKKKDVIKTESEVTKSLSEDETEVKEEITDYIDDLEEEGPVLGDVVHAEDPDYVPCEGELSQKRKDRRERRKTRGDSKTKKRKSAPSESMSEDDLQETKAATKYRYSKRKGSAPSKMNVSASHDSFVSEASVSASPVKKAHSSEEPPNLEVEEDTTDTWAEGAENSCVQESSAEIINCGCGSTEEEGLMLQCDVCLCWQHGACYNIVGEDQVPDKYICSLCDHPKLERSSHKFRHHQDWLKEGRLPRFSFSRTLGDARLEACIRRGHELTANVLQLSQILHSLRLKLHIAKEADHPKFVMWHKKWDEKKEDSDQNKGASTSVNADIMAPLHELMNIVEHDGSNLNSALTNPMMADPNIMTGGISSADVPDTSRTSSPVESSIKPNHSGVWDTSGQIVNVEQFSVQSDVLKTDDTDLPQKGHTDIVIKVNNDKQSKEGGVMDSVKTDNTSSETPITDEMSDFEEHAPAAHSLKQIKQEKGDVKSKTDDIPVTDDGCQPVSCADHRDISTLSHDQVKSDITDTKNASETNVDFSLMKDSGRISDSPKESLYISTAAETESGLGESSSILQTKSESVESELGSRTDSDIEHREKTEDGKRNNLVKVSAEHAQEISVDIAENDKTTEKAATRETSHESQSALESSQQSQKLATLPNKEPGEIAQDPLLDNVDTILSKDCTHEKMDTEMKSEVISKEETMNETNISLQKKLEASFDCGDEETVSAFKDGASEGDFVLKDCKDETKIYKEEEINQRSISEDKDKPDAEKNETDNYEGESKIMLSCKEEKPEADVHEDKTKISNENNVVKGDDECETKDSLKNVDAIKKCSPEGSVDENYDTKTTHPKTEDETKIAHPREEVEVKIHQPKEAKRSVMESEDTEDKEMGQNKSIEGMELSQSAVIDATDLSQPEDMEGAGGALDDDDTQLDDGDDLALDLGGLGAAGEGGMPGGSDLAALLSSQSELEQLATQASSALASHVPSAGIVQSVPAPIIPEAERIEPVNCKLNLLEHVQVVQTKITKRFDQIEKQLEVLEAEMGLSADTADDDCEEDSEERDPATLQARALIKLILNDVNVVQRIAEFTH
ncbi:uncharacterized protein [Panulirus ornatus]|uniref:uncharacterized protein isoform X2 n=1 Tax=Panulirus ornatus TaxID=150431 RepID=UPI003A89FDC6